MAATYRSKLLAIARRNEERMTALFSGLLSAVTREIVRNADAEGIVPRSKLYDVQARVGRLVVNMFLSPNRAEDLSPFEVLPDGSVFPLSPYMRALWAGIQEAVRLPVEQHAATIVKSAPPEVLGVMRAANVNPFAVADVVRETEVFRPNKLAQYEPPHLWVDPAGYRLSDRIWQTGTNTRRRLDMYLEEAIRDGRGALVMSKELEQFLLPGRNLDRTKAPYGTNASYDAMRLARTEVTRAHAQASEASTEMNPFVEGMKVVLSRSHPKPDICDEAAAAGPWPKGEIPAQYQIPLHPHCLCRYEYVMVDKPSDILDELRADIRRERAALVDKVGPVRIPEFVRLLLVGLLPEQVQQARASLGVTV